MEDTPNVHDEHAAFRYIKAIILDQKKGNFIISLIQKLQCSTYLDILRIDPWDSNR